VPDVSRCLIAGPYLTAPDRWDSADLSFDEAFRDAVAGLPPLNGGGTADQLATVRVIDTAGLFGGIAGFRHLAVRVRRTVDG
jgi:hypothetical protein